MKIAVLGPGSLGSVFCGLMTEAGLDVRLVGPRSDHLDAMEHGGLTLVEGARERTVRVTVATDCARVGPVDLVVVLVKSARTREAIEAARPLFGEGTLAISLQNGLGNEEVLGEVVGRDRVLSGKTYGGGVITEPGRVLVARKGKLTQVGELAGGITERARRLGDLFERAGLETRVCPEMLPVIWRKLLINVSTGAITAITGLTYGELVQVPEAVRCGIEAVAEAMAVARAAGIRLEMSDPEEAFLTAVKDLPSGFKTSMLQDVVKGVKTEIDFINGAVVRRGAQHGVPTPVNATLVAAIKGIEFGLEGG
ncbi:MAG: ketopantoate reductase family protein [bacterium]|nr:MAG: ketopantoate reductase family protein [bacterium]